MPIRPEQRWLYPIDWRELSAEIRFRRAGGRCEHCRRPHGEIVCHLGDGRWWDGTEQVWRDGRGRGLRRPPQHDEAALRLTRVILACAHLNHDPSDNRAKNLAALSGEGQAMLEKGAVDKARRNLAQLQSLCGGSCTQAQQLAAAIDSHPRQPVLTAEAVAPEPVVTHN